MSEESTDVEWAESVEGDRIPLPVRPPSLFVQEWATALIHTIAPGVWIEGTECHPQWHWNGDKAALDRLLQAIVDKAISDAVLKIERYIVKEVV